MPGEITGTATAGNAADQHGGQPAAAAPADTPPPAVSASGAPPATEESFIDVSQLPDELKPHWKRMHGAYTKAQQRFRDAGEKAALVDRFNTDPAFMLQTVQQAAAQLGYQMVKAGDGTVAAAQPPAGQPGQAPTPPQLVEAVRSRLDPSLHWMADSLASAMWAGMQMTMAPGEERQANERRTQRREQYDELSDALTEVAPGWEEHEDEMLELKQFLESDQLSHKRFGSKLALLYNLATGNAAAVTTATRRMVDAGRHRVTSGQPTRPQVVDVSEKVRGAKTNDEAWDIAAKHAVEELQRQGVRIK